MRVIEAPAPRPDRGSALVRTGASLISAGTEKQIIELARASIAGKALARPKAYRVAAGTKARVKVKLSKKGLRLIRRGRVVKVRIELTAPGSKKVLVKRTIKVRRR